MPASRTPNAGKVDSGSLLDPPDPGDLPVCLEAVLGPAGPGPAHVLAFTLLGLIVAIPMSLVHLVMFLWDHNRLATVVAGVPSEVS